MMIYLAGLMVLLVGMMVCLIMVRVLVVLLMMFWDLHTISVVILSPIHHHMLSMVPIVAVHVEGIVRGGSVDRRS